MWIYRLPLFEKEMNILPLHSHPSVRLFLARRWTGRKQVSDGGENGPKWKHGFRSVCRRGGAVGVGVSELCGEGKGRMGRWESTHYFGPFFSWWCDLGWRLPENVTELEGHFLLHTSAPRDRYLGHDEWCLNLACLTHKSIKAGEWLQGPFRFLLHHQKVLIAFQKKKNLGEINVLWRVIFLTDVS